MNDAPSFCFDSQIAGVDGNVADKPLDLDFFVVFGEFWLSMDNRSKSRPSSEAENNTRLGDQIHDLMSCSARISMQVTDSRCPDQGWPRILRPNSLAIRPF